MKDTVFNKLKAEKLDFSAYGKLPLRHDVLAIEEPLDEDRKAKVLLKHWEKLNYIRKNLKILDDYIRENKGESLSVWLKNNNVWMSDIVLKEIGKFNNDTGGISTYFLNLQNYYDEQEAKYDSLESKSKTPEEDLNSITEMRTTRAEKRKNRGKIRKHLFKDLKTNKKGYLLVEVEEEPASKEEMELAASGENVKKDPEVKKTEEVKKEEDKIVEEVKKVGNRTGKIVIFIAGIALTVGVIYAVTKKTETV